MRLAQLIKTLDNYYTDADLEDFEVRGISCNSKDIKDNFIFVAIKGTNIDGHSFIDEAIKNGARAVIVQDQGFRIKGQDKISLIKVNDTRKVLAKLSAEFYGNPSLKIKVIGITGTNGKTTVSYLVEAILKEAGFNPAVIGTIEYRFKDKVFASPNTTPGPIELQSLLSVMTGEKVDYAVIEVSSHALDQNRTLGIDFHSTIFTNLTQDHLDYHKTKEDYFQAKLKLFKNMNSNSFAVINADDECARIIKEVTAARVITYGIENQADITAQNIKFDLLHTEFLLVNKKDKVNLKTRLIGRHNVYNILAAVSFALREGLDLSTVKSAIEGFYFVPGRLERIDSGANFTVFVDYAHTEDALKNVLQTLRQLAPHKIIVVFGCGGERDKTKRPKMGEVVSKMADFVIITNDNPRSEDPRQIIDNIKRGIKKENFCVVFDRQEAIKKSLSIAKAGDIILIAGKGHEQYQILKDKRIPFDDRLVVKECLRLMSY